MAENLSPGVFIEEVPSTQNIVQAVSTSNLGVVGFSQRGPTDAATLVTTYEQYGRVFGPDTKNSFLTKSVAAFYANGGKRAFVVRVVPTDSIKANGQIQSATKLQQIETGDSVAHPAFVYTRDAASSPIKDNNGAASVVPGSFTMKWRSAGLAMTDASTWVRDGSTPLMGTGAVTKFEGRIAAVPSLAVGTGTSQIIYRALNANNQALKVEHIVNAGAAPRSVVKTTALGIDTITVTLETDAGGVVQATETANSVSATINATPDASALLSATGGGVGVVAAASSAFLVGTPSMDLPLDCVVSGTSNVVLSWSAGAFTLTFPGSAVGPVVTATSVDATGTFDRRTGIFSLNTTVAPTAAPILITATLASPTYTATSGTTVDGTGQITVSSAGLASGVLNVTSGAYTFTFTATTTPHNGAQLRASYKTNAWELQPVSNGTWGNNLRIDITGDPNYYDVLTRRYTKFTALVSMLNSTGAYEVMETYDELDFVNTESATYFPDVLNDLSDLVTVTEPGGLEAPGELSGGFGESQTEVYEYVVGGGDEQSGGRAFAFTLPQTPVGKRSVVVTYTSAADDALKTITDDGNGAMTGSVDSSGTNTIVYTSGAVSFSTEDLVKAGTVVTVKFVPNALETTHVEYFGNTIPPNATEAKTYSYTIGSTTYSFYTAGSDGTFSLSGTGATFGRNVFTDPGLAPLYRGMYALSRIDEIMQVIIPDFAGDPAVSQDQLDYAASRASQPSGGDRFIILTTSRGCNPQQAVDWFRYSLGRFSKYAALYWPWVKVADPLSNNRPIAMPPLGHIAGIYARTDASRNVGKSPGGTVDGALNYLTGLEYVSTQGERDFVYPNKINPLISSAQTGLAVWGVRTIAIESEWRYINARRLFMFMEKSVFNSTHWVVFENNGPALWAKIKSQIGGFMNNLFNEGYLAGNSAAQAYYVICDESNNPQSSIDAGNVITDVGAAPNKPAEFVRFRFTQSTL